MTVLGRSLQTSAPRDLPRASSTCPHISHDIYCEQLWGKKVFSVGAETCTGTTGPQVDEAQERTPTSSLELTWPHWRYSLSLSHRHKSFPTQPAIACLSNLGVYLPYTSSVLPDPPSAHDPGQTSTPLPGCAPPLDNTPLTAISPSNDLTDFPPQQIRGSRRGRVPRPLKHHVIEEQATSTPCSILVATFPLCGSQTALEVQHTLSINCTTCETTAAFARSSVQEPANAPLTPLVPVNQKKKRRKGLFGPIYCSACKPQIGVGGATVRADGDEDDGRRSNRVEPAFDVEPVCASFWSKFKFCSAVSWRSSAGEGGATVSRETQREERSTNTFLIDPISAAVAVCTAQVSGDPTSYSLKAEKRASCDTSGSGQSTTNVAGFKRYLTVCWAVPSKRASSNATRNGERQLAAFFVISWSQLDGSILLSFSARVIHRNPVALYTATLDQFLAVVDDCAAPPPELGYAPIEHVVAHYLCAPEEAEPGRWFAFPNMGFRRADAYVREWQSDPERTPLREDHFSPDCCIGGRIPTRTALFVAPFQSLVLAIRKGLEDLKK
ncbi:hypothetical protein BDK51DRAFT_41905 [Blyttiomyces helicus]|uniref:Uncharacterized protein n=1 Tax=Blyttiomyces helicus TaxID=388810 RepID=A0A4P9W1Y2_9FUNG|nr:hypothetical protein BDK51DRAFT_41905 [Blyttiomyces helicus]|eukprot:RKO86211.1 hypothetical protein BDK51DRAFT_41905 [Blyttiomyces helicus]